MTRQNPATPGQYAREGNDGICYRCGRKLEFREVARDAFTDEPVYRWVAVRKTKLAPIPIECPGRSSGRGPHITAHHSATGAPLDPPRSGRKVS